MAEEAKPAPEIEVIRRRVQDARDGAALRLPGLTGVSAATVRGWAAAMDEVLTYLPHRGGPISTSESDVTCPCDPEVGGGCEARRRGTPELCSASERAPENAALRAAVERLAERYENTSRDTRLAPDVVAWRLRTLLAEGASTSPEVTP